MSDDEIEVLTSPQNPDKRRKGIRRVASSGGKAAHVAIKFTPARKPQPPQRKVSTRAAAKRAIECFDLGSDDEDGDKNDEDKNSDDEECQILDDDAADDDLEELSSESFCKLCGLYLESIRDLDKHHESVHKVVFCKWCDERITVSKFKSHILSSCRMFKQIRSSHCSIHEEMETEKQLEEEKYRNCRRWCCDLCGQRYDKISLTIPGESEETFICPGCIHGKVALLRDDDDGKMNKTICEVDLESEEWDKANDEDESPAEDTQKDADADPVVVTEQNSEKVPEASEEDDDIQEIVESEESDKKTARPAEETINAVNNDSETIVVTEQNSGKVQELSVEDDDIQEIVVGEQPKINSSITNSVVDGDPTFAEEENEQSSNEMETEVPDVTIENNADERDIVEVDQEATVSNISLHDKRESDKEVVRVEEKNGSSDTEIAYVELESSTGAKNEEPKQPELEKIVIEEKKEEEKAPDPKVKSSPKRVAKKSTRPPSHPILMSTMIGMLSSSPEKRSLDCSDDDIMEISTSNKVAKITSL